MLPLFADTEPRAIFMTEFDMLMFPEWGVGDTRDLDDKALERLYDEGRYDSYDQTYTADGARWKVVNERHRADGSCLYTLSCIAVGIREDE